MEIVCRSYEFCFLFTDITFNYYDGKEPLQLKYSHLIDKEEIRKQHWEGKLQSFTF